jgi:hypothetical protein
MMLKGSGGGGGAGVGRDVIFRLIAQADPSSRTALKQFGAEVATQQKQITAAAVQETRKRTAETSKQERKARDQTQREQFRHDALVSRNYVREHLRAIDERVKAERKAEEEIARWRQRVRSNSLVLESRENIRLAREARAEQAHSARESAREAAMARRETRRGELETIRRGRGITHLIHSGVELGRGAALSGLVGSGSSETILNTLLAVEGAGSLIRGGTGTYKALRHVVGPGVLGSLGGGAGGGAAVAGGGAVAAVGAGLAAFVGALAAAVSGLATFREAAKHGVGGGADVGSGVDRVATGVAWFLSNTLGRSGAIAGGEFGSLHESDVALARQRKSGSKVVDDLRRRNEFFTGQRELVTGGFRTLTEHREGESLAGANTRMGQVAALYQQAKRSGDPESLSSATEAVKAAQQNVLSIMHDQRAESARMNQDRLSAARDEYELRKSTTSEIKQQAQEARRNLLGDVYKAATASPEERMTLLNIDRKRKSGEALTAHELGVAGGYSEFKGEFTEKNAERVADKHGLLGIFRTGRATADKLAGESAAAVKAEATAKVSVENLHKVQLELESKLDEDAIFRQFKPILEEIKRMQTDTDKRTQDAINRALLTFANTHRLN